MRQVGRGRPGAGAGVVRFLRHRWREVRSGRDDTGSVLVLVLVVAVLLIAVTTVALNNASASSGETGGYANVTTARLDAESGIQATVLQMKNATSLIDLPGCAPQTAPLAYGSYTVSVTYEDATGSALSCPLSGSLPSTMTALVDATGKFGSSTVKLLGTVTVTSTPVPLPAFDYVLYAAGKMTLDSLEPVNSGSESSFAQVYASQLDCRQDNVLSANVQAGSGGTGATVSDECAILGTLSVDGASLTMSDQGFVESLDLSGGSFEMEGGTVAGNAVVSGGDVSFIDGAGKADDPFNSSLNNAQPPTVDGNLLTSGTVSSSASGPVVGQTCSGSPSCIPSSLGMPSVPPFPQVTDPGSSGWPSGADYLAVPTASSGGGSPTYTSCSSFFTASGGGESPFVAFVNGSTAPVTVVDAPTCDVSLQGGSPSWGGCPSNDTFTLQSDVVLFVKSFTDSGCVAFDSGSVSSGSGHRLAVVVPSPGTGDIVLAPTTEFDPNLQVLLYTPGSVTYECAPSSSDGPTPMTGQVVAGQDIATYYGPSTLYDPATAGCPLTYSNQAASIVPTAVQPLLGSVSFAGETLVKV